jgi:hypothetical protein
MSGNESHDKEEREYESTVQDCQATKLKDLREEGYKLQIDG